jgi:CheY-like chemotaxis protein
MIPFDGDVEGGKATKKYSHRFAILFRAREVFLARILVVDDDYQVRKMVMTLLQRAGHDVTIANNGRSAIEASRSSASYDLVLSDAMMPVMDGHELARWIAANRPDCRIVLMSAVDAGCESCPYAPRCRVLQKPFHKQDLMSAIAESLK